MNNGRRRAVDIKIWPKDEEANILWWSSFVSTTNQPDHIVCRTLPIMIRGFLVVGWTNMAISVMFSLLNDVLHEEFLNYRVWKFCQPGLTPALLLFESLLLVHNVATVRFFSNIDDPMQGVFKFAIAQIHVSISCWTWCWVCYIRLGRQLESRNSCVNTARAKGFVHVENIDYVVLLSTSMLIRP